VVTGSPADWAALKQSIAIKLSASAIRIVVSVRAGKDRCQLRHLPTSWQLPSGRDLPDDKAELLKRDPNEWAAMHYCGTITPGFAG
jgi:hypothetical protein